MSIDKRIDNDAREIARSGAKSLTEEDLQTCLQVLQKLIDAPAVIRENERLRSLLIKAYKAGRRDEERAARWRQEAEDRATQATTAMVQIQRDALAAHTLPPPSPAIRTLNRPATCYICKAHYTDVHFFYHQLCPACAEINYGMRAVRADLTGRTALMTGGRIKIGYQTALRLLRDGAKVIVTTRFPHAAARRFHAEADSAEWAARLHLYGLDLRNIPAVESFTQHLLDTEPALDIVIHNAAQTIRRPSEFYRDLLAQERCAPQTLALEARQMVRQPSHVSLTPFALASDLPALPPLNMAGSLGEDGGSEMAKDGLMLADSQTGGDVLPAFGLEDNEERADSRSVNSWLLRLDQVSAPEMLEVQLVNSVAPFLLNSRLKPLLMRSPFARRFIVNVSAMEGQFQRHKTVFHPHTNMAKAALNMMTRTAGDDYAQDSIYMTSVDTGWVTDENPTPKRERGQEQGGFFAPLDIVDGMARIYHPIAQGINHDETPFYGVFLKDYAPCAW